MSILKGEMCNDRNQNGFNYRRSSGMYGIGRNTMRKLVDWGKLPVLKVGRKTIIRRIRWSVL